MHFSRSHLWLALRNLCSHSCPNSFSACVSNSNLPRGAEGLQSCSKPSLHLCFSGCLVRLPHPNGSQNAIKRWWIVKRHKWLAFPVQRIPVHRQSRRWSRIFCTRFKKLDAQSCWEQRACFVLTKILDLILKSCLRNEYSLGQTLAATGPMCKRGRGCAIRNIFFGRGGGKCRAFLQQVQGTRAKHKLKHFLNECRKL